MFGARDGSEAAPPGEHHFCLRELLLRDTRNASDPTYSARPLSRTRPMVRPTIIAGPPGSGSIGVSKPASGGSVPCRSIAFERESPFVAPSNPLQLNLRTGAYHEVDFPAGADQIPFESKYAESVDRRDAQVMEQAFGRGVVATRRTLHLDGKTALIPTALVLAILAYR